MMAINDQEKKSIQINVNIYCIVSLCSRWIMRTSMDQVHICETNCKQPY